MEARKQLQPKQNLREFYEQQQAAERFQCEDLPEKVETDEANQLKSATTSGNQANEQRPKGCLVSVMAQKRLLNRHNYSEARANPVLIPESKSRFNYPETADVQLLTRSGYRSDRRMISTQCPSQSSQSKSRSDFPEGVEAQACTEFRRGFGPEPRAIAPYPPDCSPQSKSRFLLPMLPDGQSSSTDNRVLQSLAPYYQAAATAANKNNYGRPPNTNFFRSQSLESCTTDNDEVCTCEHNQTMWGTSSSRRASKLPSWPKPQTSTRNDTQDNGGKKSKMLVTIGSSSAQWKTAPRAVQLLATS